MLYYLFGIVGVESPLPKASPVALERIACAGLAALVERVPASEYAPHVLQERLASLEWVAGAARRHSAVLERAMAAGAVIPARLCTLFGDAAAVERSLEQGRYRYSATLDFLAGRFEWGVKVFCDEEQLDAVLVEEDPDLCSLARASLSANPGHAYVLRKRFEARRAELREDRKAEVTGMILDEVSSRTVALRDKPLLAGDITGRLEPMALNLAVLAPRSDWEEISAVLSDLADEHAAEGFSIETSGPWPAYSFCGEEVADEAPPSSGEPAGRLATRRVPLSHPLTAAGGAP